jgi:pimeloyl-ACP methyl ester carboxylesterase
LLNDEAIINRFRVVAFDLPWHGRSLPPDGAWDDEYRLTRKFYMEFIGAFCDALELDHPVLLGCSMGGYVLLDIAIERREAYRAFVSVQPRAYAPSWANLSPLLDRPELNYHSFATVVRSTSSPLSPADRRREVEWIYSQAGPGVLAGDFWYAAQDHDVRTTMKNIDTKDAGFYVIAGDWDPSCLREHTDELAGKISGLRVIRLPDCGHFPPSENPLSFGKAILPILGEIFSRT